ncbi:MAG: exodeoxyribonuclease VII large subunit [Neisseriaceae bacterium]|nr:MAG: exodeoxyribonuclease VII large subunit [Neisseriaceae bacterium]
MKTEKSDAITVTQLNSRAKHLLETNFSNFWIQGEISGITQSSLGHYYFTLKDDKSQVSCALFKHQAKKSQFDLKEGEEVQLSGKVTLYEPRGHYQIIVDKIEPKGLGQLYIEYIRLKEKLEKLGYFDLKHKKSIPFFPKKIGVITSASGAALRDILTTLKRRMSQIGIVIYPVMVQGKDSAVQIANAINLANNRDEVDILIVARGGGSLEDLWSFNEEIVVESIYQSKIPVVSGVGHETDFTLTDFVADLRAPTPTGAAELVSPNKEDLLKELNSYLYRIQQILLNRYNEASQRLDLLARLLIKPSQILNGKKQGLTHYHVLLKNEISEKLNYYHLKLQRYILSLQKNRPEIGELKKELQYIKNSLLHEWQMLIHTKKSTLTTFSQLIEAVSPKKMQERGYSIVTDINGNVVSSSRKLKNNQRLKINFIDGQTKVIVDSQLDLFN